MIAFPGMLVSAAQEAGMAVPKNPDKFDKEQYPHFAVFCGVQLGRAMSSWTEHWENAHVIAKVPEKEIRAITVQGLLDKGLKAVVG